MEEQRKYLAYYADEVLKTTDRKRTLFLIQCIEEVILKIKNNEESE